MRGIAPYAGKAAQYEPESILNVPKSGKIATNLKKFMIIVMHYDNTTQERLGVCFNMSRPRLDPRRIRTSSDYYIPHRDLFRPCKTCGTQVEQVLNKTGRYKEYCSNRCRYKFRHKSVRKEKIFCLRCNAPLDRAGELCQKCYLPNRPKHSITKEAVGVIFASQGYRCRICFKDVSGRDICLDHDHRCCSSSKKSCGKCIRGILCRKCNMALGLFGDDPNVLREALKYLSIYGLE